jgi:DNA adenine methylase
VLNLFDPATYPEELPPLELNMLELYPHEAPPSGWWNLIDWRELSAPFPWFGGKSKVADLVWERFGEVVNYVEPFYATGAVLLGRPHAPTIETVNDIDALLVNFWRAVKYDPNAVAQNCDWPVHEAEIHAWHKRLVKLKPYVKARLEGDPFWFHPVIAGRWVWGLCAWIGSGWCTGNKSDQIPHLSGGDGMGVHAKRMRLPHLGAGTGGLDDHPCAHYGKGVHSQGMRLSQQLPELGGQWGSGKESGAKQGRGIHSPNTRTRLYDVMGALSQRLRYTRVTCGDFERILSPAVTWRHGTTGVFLDPPYPGDAGSTGGLYTTAKEEREVFDRAFRYCVENGADKRLRIGFCYYDGTLVDSKSVSAELAALGWEIVPWRARGGYGGQSGDNKNSTRERIAFSLGCLRAKQGTLF